MTKPERRMLWALAIVLALLIVFTVAKFVMAHEWYYGLRGYGGIDCCADRDCAPAPHRETPGGVGFEVFVGGEWRVPPPNTVLQDAWSPDGQVHVCCVNGCDRPNPYIRCIVPLGRGV